MPRRRRTRTPSYRRTIILQRLVAVSALVAVASGMVALDATAENAASSATAETPTLPAAASSEDRLEVDRELAAATRGSATELAEAVEARLALTAQEPRVVPRGSVWDRLARCEASGNWHINTGNGFYGGLQFTLSSWRWVGGTGYPHEHPREVQIRKAERLLARQGWSAWPSCSRTLGLR